MSAYLYFKVVFITCSIIVETVHLASETFKLGFIHLIIVKVLVLGSCVATWEGGHSLWH